MGPVLCWKVRLAFTPPACLLFGKMSMLFKPTEAKTAVCEDDKYWPEVFWLFSAISYSRCLTTETKPLSGGALQVKLQNIYGTRFIFSFCRTRYDNFKKDQMSRLTSCTTCFYHRTARTDLRPECFEPTHATQKLLLRFVIGLICLAVIPCRGQC